MTASSIPAQLTAGDTWAWTRSFADYPAPTWVATVYFVKADGSFEASASASGSDHAFSIPAATTAGYAAGRYKWTVRVSDGTDAHVIEEGWVDVLADPASSGNYDPRSRARRLLDAVQATLENKATVDQQAMSLGGRSISRIPLPELLQWEDKLKAQVSAEEAGSKAGYGRNIGVRFKRS